MLYLLLVICLLLKYSYPRPTAKGERCDPCLLHQAMLEMDPKFEEKFKTDIKKLVHQLDRHGNTALHLAVMRDFKDGIKFLLNNGAQVSGENDEGFNVLQEATCRGDPDTMLQILRHAKMESTALYNKQRQKFIDRLKSVRDSKWEFSFDGKISALKTGPLEVIFNVIPVPGRITIYKRGSALRMSIYDPMKDKDGKKKDNKNNRSKGDNLRYTVLFNPKYKDSPDGDKELVIMDLRKNGDTRKTTYWERKVKGYGDTITDKGKRYRKYRVKQDENIVEHEVEILQNFKASTFWMDNGPELGPKEMGAKEAKQVEIFGEQHPTKKVEFLESGMDLIMHRRLEHTKGKLFSQMPINKNAVKWEDYVKTFGSLLDYGKFPIGRQRSEGYIDLNVKAEITMAEVDETHKCTENCKPSLDYLLDVYALLLPYVHVSKVKDYFGKLQNNKVLNGLPTKMRIWLKPDFQRYVGKMFVGGMIANKTGLMSAADYFNFTNMDFDFHYDNLEGEELKDDFFDIPKGTNPNPDIMRYLYYFPAF